MKLKWGILGYAKIASGSVMPAIVRSRNAELYTVASRDLKKLEDCKKNFDCQKYYNSYDELLDDPDVQAVYIPLPNSLHKKWSIKAMKKGKHVLCEKPIALNSKECRKMMDKAIEKDVILMEAFMYRYTLRTQEVMRILNSGIIGEIKYINSNFRFFFDREDNYRLNRKMGGGSLYDVGCYSLNFADMIMGSAPVSVKGQSTNVDGVDMNFAAVLKYGSGALCVISCGFNSFNRVFTEVIGTKGMIEIPDTFFDNEGIITITTSDGKVEVKVEKSDKYVLEIEDFSDAVLNNRKPKFGMEETLRNMEVLDRLMKIVDHQ